MAYKNYEDQKKAWRKHYAENKDKYRQRNIDRREKIRRFLASLKEGKSCSKCGGFFPAKALDWHHRNPKEKEFSISNAINRSFSEERILAEVAKCDLICANCHRTF